MNSDELRRLKRVERRQRIESLNEEFLEISPEWVHNQSEAIEFVKQV